MLIFFQTESEKLRKREWERERERKEREISQASTYLLAAGNIAY